MDMGSTIGLRSDHSYFQRGLCRATADANLIWLSQRDIENLKRRAAIGQVSTALPKSRAFLLERADDCFKSRRGNACLNA